MKHRIKLSQRVLPRYTKGEEITNMITHIVGGAIAIGILILCIIRSVYSKSVIACVGGSIYGSTMIAVYAISSIYHGLHKSTGKKVMQIIDHCAIYFLIAGTYTPILLSKLIPAYPIIGWSLLVAQWCLCICAVTLTAIDLHHYRIISMICYVGMGWGIIFFLPEAINVLTLSGFSWLLSGGIVYTIGAVLYGIGVKKRWMHCVFHIFVVIGSILQAISILFYVL